MAVLKTQASSEKRLKNDTLGNEALTELYKSYQFMNIEDFRIFAEGVVMAGGGKQTTKLSIVNSMYDANTTKEKILTKAQNFILAGLGLGV